MLECELVVSKAAGSTEMLLRASAESMGWVSLGGLDGSSEAAEEDGAGSKVLCKFAGGSLVVGDATGESVFDDDTGESFGVDDGTLLFDFGVSAGGSFSVEDAAGVLIGAIGAVGVAVGPTIGGVIVCPATGKEVVCAAGSLTGVEVVVANAASPFPAVKTYGGSYKPSMPGTQDVHPGLMVKSSVGTDIVGEQGLYVAVYHVYIVF